MVVVILRVVVVVVVIGIIKGKKFEKKCKNGSVLRNYFIEDRYGNVELAVFSSEYNEEDFKIGNVIQFAGTVTKRFWTKKLTFLSSKRGKGMIQCFKRTK